MKEYISRSAVDMFLHRPVEHRPRIYGELITGESAGQIVRLASLQQFDKYAADLGSIWISDTTIEDIVRSK